MLFIASACDSEQAPSGARAEAPVPVEVATAERRNVARQVNAVGTLFGSESVSITAKVTEQVSAVYFEGGEQVQRGQVLAELTSAQQLAMLSEARANLRENQLQFDRLTNLGRDIATAAEIDVARARVDASEARLAAIESQVADRRIVAPFSTARSVARSRCLRMQRKIRCARRRSPTRMFSVLPRARRSSRRSWCPTN